jgi:trk system potassium uptake protein TrkH
VVRDKTSSLFPFTTPVKFTGAGIIWLILSALGFLSGVTGLILEYGFVRFDQSTGTSISSSPLPLHMLRYAEYGAMLCFILVLWSKIIFLPNRREFFKEHIVEAVFSLGAIAGIAISISGENFAINPGRLHFWLMIYLTIQLMVAFVKFNNWLIQTIVYPARATLLGFGMVIVIGSLLLSLPCSTYSDRFTGFGNNYVDNLFTATSAVCVTGLTVRDTGTDYTPFGQLIILLLIQIGGLGIIIFGTIFSMLIGRQVSIQETSLVMDLYSQQEAGQIRRVVKFVLISTFLIEGIGAVLMYPMWIGSSSGEKIYKSIFHSISVFCNAGFGLEKDNLVSLSSHWQVYGVIASLIIIGGIGFPVMANVTAVTKYRLSQLFRFTRPDHTHIDLDLFRVTRLTLQTKIVFVTTFLLITLGALTIFLIETPTKQQRWGRTVQYEDVVVRNSPGILRNRSWEQRLLDSYFLSVTSRTAGFNSVEMESGKLHPATFMTVISLMIIGGSPASVAGGMKTVTFAVLLATALGTLRHRRNVEAYGRTIDYSLIRRSLVVAFIYIGLVWAIAFGLVFAQPQMSFLELLFESSSACGTVGLSMGVSPNLGLEGRLLDILGMFAGRLGPLTLLFAMAGRPRTGKYEYPSEALITG